MFNPFYEIRYAIDIINWFTAMDEKRLRFSLSVIGLFTPFSDSDDTFFQGRGSFPFGLPVKTQTCGVFGEKHFFAKGGI